MAIHQFIVYVVFSVGSAAVLTGKTGPMDVNCHPSPPRPRKTLPLFAQPPRPPSSDPQNMYYAEGRTQLVRGGPRDGVGEIYLGRNSEQKRKEERGGHAVSVGAKFLTKNWESWGNWERNHFGASTEWKSARK